MKNKYGQELTTHAATEQDKGRCAQAPGSVEKLRQLATAAWIEAEAVGVAAERSGTVPNALMVLKARDLIRDVLHVLNTTPPNTELTDRRGAGSVK